MNGGRQDDSGIPPEADIVELVEQALLAVRRDQSRRRPPWADGGPRGHGQHGHGHHGGHWGGPYGPGPWGPGRSEVSHEAADEAAANQDETAGQADASPTAPDSGGPVRGTSGRPTWGGQPGGMPFGDSARPGPGRRGRDGSLGRIARVRMLEALEAADADGRSLSVSGVAAAIGVDQPRASRLVQEGVERGLVRRIPDPSDARRALIQLTSAGRAQLGEFRSHRRSAVETALAAFTPEEARTFAELFDRFVRAWPRPASDAGDSADSH